MPAPRPVPPVPVSWLLQGIGPHCEDIAAVAQDDPATWAITFHDASQVLLNWFDAPSRLELLTAVCPLEPQTPNVVLETLLGFSLFGRDNGGTRMALDPQDRVLYLVRDLPVDGLGLSDLRDALRSLVGLAERWHTCLAALPPYPGTALTTPPTNPKHPPA